jgi:hypothetical protein
VSNVIDLPFGPEPERTSDNSDSVSVAMDELANALSNLTDGQKRRMKQIVDRIVNAIGAIEKEYPKSDYVATGAVAFAILSMADGLMRQKGHGSHDGVVKLLS